MKTGIELMSIERQVKQIEKHGFTAEHHAMHPEWYDKGQLLHAAVRLMDYDKDDITEVYKKLAPENWDLVWWTNLCDKPKYERIIIAGALIAAELDRLNYLQENNTEGRV